jgi:type I restriction enzyme R subunit
MHKTVQARILAYAEANGWTLVSREEAEQRRGFDPEVPPADRAMNRSLFFNDLLDAKLGSLTRAMPSALLGQFRHLHTDIHGNRADYASGRWGSLFLDGYSRQKTILSDKITNTRQIERLICRIYHLCDISFAPCRSESRK